MLIDPPVRHGDFSLQAGAMPGKAGGKAPRAKLRASHVTFRYGDQVALNDVSVPLYEHAVTAIMGPSGCGKSTLLRVFNRMHELYPDQSVEGEILLDGHNILAASVDVNVVRATVGMVFQQPAPFPMSVYDNVAFGPRLYGRLSRKDLDQGRSNRPCAAPRCGTRSRTCSPSAASTSPAASSNGCASPAPSP